MSGEQLRSCAIEGDHERLASFLKGIANPCSADEYGITPLMYAVWNGHVECVKYLVSNDMGVSRIGRKGSALHLTSERGYSALHLAALDCPEWSIKEITMLLMIMNVNRTLKCTQGKTALEIAEVHNNKLFISAWSDFHSPEKADEIEKMASDTIEILASSYAYRKNSTLFVKPWKANFPVPKFIYKEERMGAIPHGMHLHEHHLEPLIDNGFNKMRSTDSLHCLDFVLEETKINEERRKDLVKVFDEQWIAPELPNLMLKGHL